MRTAKKNQKIVDMFNLLDLQDVLRKNKKDIYSYTLMAIQSFDRKKIY